MSEETRDKRTSRSVSLDDTRDDLQPLSPASAAESPVELPRTDPWARLATEPSNPIPVAVRNTLDDAASTRAARSGLDELAAEIETDASLARALLKNAEGALRGLEFVKKIFGLQTLTDALDVSVRLTSMIVTEVEKGNKIIIQDQDQKRRELVIQTDAMEPESWRR